MAPEVFRHEQYNLKVDVYRCVLVVVSVELLQYSSETASLEVTSCSLHYLRGALFAKQMWQATLDPSLQDMNVPFTTAMP
jgi:hypothetical protein